MLHMSENLLLRDTQDSMIGLKKLELDKWTLVSHHKDSKMQKKCFTQWEELISLMIQLPLLCIGKLMEITPQVNKRTETTTGNLIQLSTVLVSVRRKFWMELPLLFIMRDMKNNSQKLSSFRKLSKTIKLLPLTTLESQRIWDKAKLTEEQNSFTELRT